MFELTEDELTQLKEAKRLLPSIINRAKSSGQYMRFIDAYIPELQNDEDQQSVIDALHSMFYDIVIEYIEPVFDAMENVGISS